MYTCMHADIGFIRSIAYFMLTLKIENFDCMTKTKYLFVIFAALTVRYLTRRYIGEYKSNSGKLKFLDYS